LRSEAACLHHDTAGSCGFAADACHLARFPLPGTQLWDQIVQLATNFWCGPFDVPAPQAAISVKEPKWKSGTRINGLPVPMLSDLREGWVLRRQRTSQKVGTREKNMLRKIALAAIVVAFAGGSALAQDSCESKAMGKDGKPLAGAAKTSFMKKCMHDSCEAKAMSADGKKLSGAAKNSFMKKCETG
jgi:hypothetical protein